MTFSIYQYVFWLQITVYNTHIVEVLKSKDHLSCIEPGSLLVEATLDLLQMVEQFTSIDELHDQIQSLIVLEGILQTHYEWMTELLQDLSFNYTWIET